MNTVNLLALHSYKLCLNNIFQYIFRYISCPFPIKFLQENFNSPLHVTCFFHNTLNNFRNRVFSGHVQCPVSTHTHTHTHTYLHTHIHTCMHACIHTYIHTFHGHKSVLCSQKIICAHRHTVLRSRK